MNLTLSLAINGGGTASTTTKKRKLLRDSVVIDDDVMSCDCDGGDRSRAVRLLQDRERMMMAKLDADDDPRVAVAAAAPDDDGLRLMHLLLSSVAAAEAGDAHAAASALHEVYPHASVRGGDPAQRVAAYFADALASSRLLVRSPPTTSPAAAAPPTCAERFLAYTMFYQASPIYQLAHFTANQAIVEAFEISGRRRLHVVDFDVSYGFQWPSLIQSLSHAAASTTSTTTSNSSHDGDGGEPPVSLRITGLGTSSDELRQTEARLVRFASGCPNLRFEFEGIVVDDGQPESGRRCHERIKVDDDATVVVNLVFPATHQSSTSTSTREEACSSALARIRSLNPSLLFLVEKHGGSGGGNATSSGVLPAFTASLRYFAAVFDSLHECLPADSAERLAIERNHLGAEISDSMASLEDCNTYGGGGGDDDDEMAAEPTSSCWKKMMERAGFERVELSSRTVSQAKLLLKMKSGGCGGGFRVMEGEGGRAMSLGWRDRAQLITATGWRRRRRSINKQALS